MTAHDDFGPDGTRLIASIKLLVTDLDNTLYDWLSSFVPAFYSMIEVASRILEVDQEQLLDEMKTVHQRYHNSEHPYALLEAATVLNRWGGATRLQRKEYLTEAFAAFNRVRKNDLRLYPGVRETLKQIRKQGTVVVGHTDAVAENSLHRLELLGLSDELECLYAPESRAPQHPDPLRPGIHEAYRGCFFLLPSNHRKPDPAVLKDICLRHGIPVEETLYVGDSISRDVAMAKNAGTYAAWARYGSRRDAALWDKLVRVTHWSDEDVVREKRLIDETRNVRPDVVIDSFPELLNSFQFEAPQASRTTARS
jgi:FMN phosphatase YigB (HAD superfamily)